MSKTELILQEFPELRIKDGVIRHGACHVCDPDLLDERQIRAGVAIGLRRFMLMLSERHDKLQALIDEDPSGMTNDERKRLQEKASLLLKIVGELGTWEGRYGT